MRLISVKGSCFQSYESFDVQIPYGPLCIVGENMSGKTTFARSVIWALCGKFPYPNLGRFTKDMVRPGNDPGAKPGSKRASKDDPATIVQVKIAVPRLSTTASASTGADGTEATQDASAPAPMEEDILIITRTEGGDKSQLILSSEDGSYSFDGEVAQDIILNRAKIPTFGSTKDRIDLLMRSLWYGVGQATSFFAAAGTERKKIIESINPFTVLPKLEEESGKRLKSSNVELAGLKESGYVQVGALRSKREELQGKIAPFLQGSPDGRGPADALSATLDESVSARARALLASPEFLRQKSVPEIDKEAAEANRDLAGLASAEQTLQRILTLQSSLDTLSSQLAAAGGAAEVKRLEDEARALRDMMGDAKALLAEVGDLRTKELGQAAATEKSAQRLRELEREAAEIAALASDVTSKIQLTLAILSGIGESPKTGAASGEDALAASAALETNLSRILAVKLSSPEAVVAAIKAKKEELSRLDSQARIARHEEKAEELLASVGQAKTKLAELSSADAVASSLQLSLRTLGEKIEASQARVLELEGLLQEVSRLSDIAGQLSGEEGQASNSTSPGSISSGSTSSGSAAAPDVAATKRALNSFEAVLSKAAGAASTSAVEAFTAAQLTAIDQLTETVAQNTKELDEALGKLSSARDRASGARSDEKREATDIATYQRALAMAQSAEKSGGEALCKECGSALSREHIEIHLRDKKANHLKIGLQVGALQNEVDQLEKSEKELRLKLKSAEVSQRSSEAALSEVLEACAKFLSQVGRQSGQADSLAGCLLNAQRDEAKAQVLAQEATLAAKTDEGKALAASLADLSKSLAETLEVPYDALGDHRSLVTSLGLKVSSLEAARRAEAEAEKRQAQELRLLAGGLQNSIDATISTCQGFLSATGYQGPGSVQFLQELSALSVELGASRDAVALEMNGLRDAAASIGAAIATKLAELSASLGHEGPSDYESLKSGVAALDSEAKKEAEVAAKKSQEVSQLVSREASARASLEATAQSLPEELRTLDSQALAKKRALVESRLAELGRLRDAARAVAEVVRLAGEVTRMESSAAAYEEHQDELADEVTALAIIKGLLAPNGDTRTLALAPDVAAVVTMTNEYLAQLNLRHSLAIELKLEKGDDSQPAVEISFEVDGSTSGRIMPSESQRMIVGLVCDFAVSKLLTREGFVFVDEPETGLDEVNKVKLTHFLKGMSPQTILITNNASSGFEHKITTGEIRRSVGKKITAADFGIVMKTKVARKKGKGEKGEAEALEDAGAI